MVTVTCFYTSLVPRLSCEGEGEIAWYCAHCLCMRQVLLVTYILLRSTKITVNSVYLLKGRTAGLCFLWDSYGRFLSQKQHRFDGNCLHCFVRSDQWTSKEETVSQVLQCLAGMHKHVDNSCEQAKSWVPLSLLCHRPPRAWSVTGIFYTGEVGIPCQG